MVIVEFGDHGMHLVQGAFYSGVYGLGMISSGGVGKGTVVIACDTKCDSSFMVVLAVEILSHWSTA